MEPEQAAQSDRSLAERVLAEGDERAFRTLYRRHTPYLYQFALRLLGGIEQEAEEVVQETWIRAVEKLDGFRGEATLKTWLGGIALNLCRGLFRRRSRDWLEFKEDVPDVTTMPHPEDRIDLEDAITRLPDGHRAVFVLHDLEGYKHHEVAAQLGISAGTSKSQLFHARKKLRTLLQERPAARMDDHA